MLPNRIGSRTTRSAKHESKQCRRSGSRDLSRAPGRRRRERSRARASAVDPRFREPDEGVTEVKTGTSRVSVRLLASFQRLEPSPEAPSERAHALASEWGPSSRLEAFESQPKARWGAEGEGIGPKRRPPSPPLGFHPWPGSCGRVRGCRARGRAGAEKRGCGKTQVEQIDVSPCLKYCENRKKV